MRTPIVLYTNCACCYFFFYLIEILLLGPLELLLCLAQRGAHISVIGLLLTDARVVAHRLLELLQRAVCLYARAYRYRYK